MRKAYLSAWLAAFAAAQIRSARVFSEPNIVGAQAATLSVQFMSQVAAPSGSILKVKVPGSAQVRNGDHQCGVTGV